MNANDVALVTGGNKGIGRQIVHDLAQQGFTVYLGARSPERGHSAVQELTKESATVRGGRPAEKPTSADADPGRTGGGLDIRFVQLDVTDLGSVEAAVDKIETETGRLDVLVNNAGIMVESGVGSTAVTAAQLRETYEVNVFGVVTVTSACVPLLRRSHNPRIVNMSSGLGSLTLLSDPTSPLSARAFLAYSSSKAALNALTLIYAYALRADGLLAHTAGLPDWVGPVEELYDWPSATARLAAQAPRWEPGSTAGYHSLTQGFLVGEVVRRITGRSVGDFFADEVAGPLGADFHIGLPAEHDHRVALTVPPSSRDEDYLASAPGSSMSPDVGASPEATGIRVRDGNSAAWRRAQIPAASGFGNARSVALVQSVMACGGAVRGRRLLSQAGCDRVREEQFNGVDRILGMPVRWGLGYGLFGSTYGWGGWGGAIVMVEPDNRMAVAYVTNQMREPADDNRGLEIITAAYDGLTGLRA